MYKVAKEASEPYYLVTLGYDYGEDYATEVIKIKKEEFNENVQKALHVLDKFTAIDNIYILTKEDFDNNKETLEEIFSEKEELDILKLLSTISKDYDEFIENNSDSTITREFFESYINFNIDWLLRGAFGNGDAEVLGLCKLVSVEVIYIDKGYEVNWED